MKHEILLWSVKLWISGHLNSQASLNKLLHAIRLKYVACVSMWVVMHLIGDGFVCECVWEKWGQDSGCQYELW